MPKSVDETVAYNEMRTGIRDVFKEKVKDLGFEWDFDNPPKIEDKDFFEQRPGVLKAARMAKEQLRAEIILILREIEIPK